MKKSDNSLFRQKRTIAVVLFLCVCSVIVGILLSLVSKSCKDSGNDVSESSNMDTSFISESISLDCSNTENSLTSISSSEISEDVSFPDLIIPELGTYEEDFSMVVPDDIIELNVKLYNEHSSTFNKIDGAEYLDDVAVLIQRYAPDTFLTSAACAIAYTEGGSGKSGVYTVTNNCFGLRAASTWDGYVFARSTGRVYKDYKTAVQYGAYDFFRAYESMEESVLDFIDVMINKYTAVLDVKTPKAFFKSLLSQGYGSKDIFSTWMYIVNLYELKIYDDK